MKKILKVVLVISLILVAICAVDIWISYNVLTVSNFTVTSDKITSPFRIVLISDLHNHQFGSYNEKLIEKIREQSPDIIIVDGDMINADSDNDDVAVELIYFLREIAPVYYSYGNHEYGYIEAGHDSLDR